MRFGILGPLEVWDRDQLVGIGGPQQRALLAVLLLNANSVVSVERLIDQLWGERPPDSARHLLKGCIAGLRRALGVARTDRLLTRPPGYLLEVLPGERDLDRFDELAGTATVLADQPAQRVAMLREALACWRGPALDGLDLDACRAEAARLEERRLAVLEECIDLDLRLGRYPALVAELQVLVRQHPLRERLWAQLMLALHGADRQTDALAVYQQIRQSLVEQLGVEPNVPLRQAHHLVLAGAPAGPDTTSRPVAPARTERPVPAQLPADVAAFTGRAGELAELTRRLDAAPPTSTAVLIHAVLGTAGVGKTALAVRWAHAVRDRFPDGQLYVNLRGYDVGGRPLTAGTALAGFLTALGVATADVPDDLDARAARFRTAVTNRRMLVVLDNAVSVEQVIPLLPGTSSCVVVVTSRSELVGLTALHGAQRLELEPLPAGDANSLLRRLIGARVTDEPVATAALIEHCARLPLALRVAAARATGSTGRLADLVTALDDPSLRLELLTAGSDPPAGVPAALSWSYRRLPPQTAQVFRLAGRHPGPDLAPDELAARPGTCVCAIRRHLDLLAGEHLVQRTAPGRYAMHGLLRAYAAGIGEAPTTRQPAAHRPVTCERQCEAEPEQPRRIPRRSPSPCTITCG
ncbi:MAG TPA: AfsR/SARP family transcriptional regulator [Actinophytocola sp.]|uniref:AfsR/SARP family transcriptional regulator n=1 Tax=Actinophytocola sp. TaxID=1872138 RepID=UPI002DB700F5|nr:AfsR/SARP family transcriptional regulator [Actinophytocola sp.]HEU5471238.1 AfsR/SARP family transcriptional regulator [Actinophytocola sp.]